MKVDSKWIRTKSDEQAIDDGCTFDIAAADRVRFFFERFLVHSKGQFAGKPFTLFDWQWYRVIGPLFGWRAADGTRRFRRAGIAVAKKNGKSTLMSGIGLYLLLSDNEPGAEVYTAAADRKQASIIFNEAANMVNASPALKKRINVKEVAKEMITYEGRSILTALSSDVATKEGFNANGVLFDEIHAQPNWNLWNVLRFSGASRRQPLLIWITTAGLYDPESLWQQQWNAALDVQENRTVDAGFLPVIYAASESDDWKSEDAFRKANPSYGDVISRRDWQEAVNEAQESGLKENNYKRYRLNLSTKQAERWIPAERWDACASELVTEKRLTGRECIIGLDLAATKDLAAAALVFREGSRYQGIPLFWCPRDTLLRRKRENRTSMDAWVRAGLINVTESRSIDYRVIRKTLNQLAERFNVKQIGIDPWNAVQIATDLESDGFDVKYVRTGFASISAATKEFEKLVLAGDFLHPAHPVLDWCAQNIAVKEDESGNVKPDKARSAEKIDGIVAMIIALACHIAEPEDGAKTVYEKRGIMIL